MERMAKSAEYRGEDRFISLALYHTRVLGKQEGGGSHLTLGGKPDSKRVSHVCMCCAFSTFCFLHVVFFVCFFIAYIEGNTSYGRATETPFFLLATLRCLTLFDNLEFGFASTGRRTRVEPYLDAICLVHQQ